MSLKPIGDNIIVKPEELETKTASGIIIPDSSNEERPERGEVIAVGPGRILDNGSRREIEVSVGQTVIFKKYSPNEIEIDDQKFLVIGSEDVIAIVE